MSLSSFCWVVFSYLKESKFYGLFVYICIIPSVSEGSKFTRSSASGSLFLPTLLCLWSPPSISVILPQILKAKENNELETHSSLFYIPSSFSLLSFSLFIVFSKENSLEFVSIVQVHSCQEYNLKISIWNLKCHKLNLSKVIFFVFLPD